MITSNTRKKINIFTMNLYKDLLKVFDDAYVNNIMNNDLDSFLNLNHELYQKEFDQINFNNSCFGLPYDSKAKEYYSETIYFCSTLKAFVSVCSFMLLADIDICNYELRKVNTFNTNKGYELELKGIVSAVSLARYYNKLLGIETVNNKLWNDILRVYDKYVNNKTDPKIIKYIKRLDKKLHLFSATGTSVFKTFVYRIKMYNQYLFSSDEDAIAWLINTTDYNVNKNRTCYGKMFMTILNTVRNSLKNINDPRIFELFKFLRNFKFEEMTSKKIDELIDHVVTMSESTIEGIDLILNNLSPLIIELLYHDIFKKKNK